MRFIDYFVFVVDKVLISFDFCTEARKTENIDTVKWLPPSSNSVDKIIGGAMEDAEPSMSEKYARKRTFTPMKPSGLFSKVQV